MSVQKFGGSHTVTKLDVVQKYLNAYVTVMKNNALITHYVDGFAGSGSSEAKKSFNNDPLLFEIDDIVQGSVSRALQVDPPFDKYMFIDNDKENIKSLEEIKANHEHNDKIIIKPGDANKNLLQVAEYLNSNNMYRAVVFLDPFGLSVKWETIIALAETKKVDLWYLVPVLAMSRQIKDNGEFLTSANKIDALWGSQDWRSKAVVQSSVASDLFGSVDMSYEKTAKAEQFANMFQEHLKTIFKGGVADKHLRLGRGNLHEFSLMFACANPYQAAYRPALRIANHLIKGK